MCAEEPDEEDWEDEETLKRLKNIKVSRGTSGLGLTDTTQKLSDKDINKTLAKADLMVVVTEQQAVLTLAFCRRLYMPRTHGVGIAKSMNHSSKLPAASN